MGRRSRWVVLGLWVVAVGASLPFALRIGPAESNDLLALLPSKAQSTEVLRLERQLPSGRNLHAVVVFRRASGLTSADRARVALVAERVRGARIPGAGEVSGVAQSPDGRVALFTVAVSPDQSKLVSAVSRLHELSNVPGLETEVTGTAGFDADLFSSFAGIDSKLLFVTAGLVIVLLLLTYQSPFLWTIPLVGVLLAVIVADAVVFGLAQAGLTVTGENIGLLTVVIFGAGTDYALLLTARYREELRLHRDRRDAMSVALRRALPALTASAGTVAAALLCLLVADFNVTRSFGIVGAVGVACAFLAMVTAYPALLVACSRRVFWPRIPREGSSEPSEQGVWASIATSVSRHPRRFWVGTGAVLVVMAVGLVTVNTSVTTLDDLPSSSAAVKGERLLLQSFLAGTATPIDVIVTVPSTLGPLRAALERTPGISSVGPVERAGRLARFQVVPSSVSSGRPAFSLVQRVRAVASRESGGTALVGGQPAQDYDISTVSLRDELMVMPLVLGVVLLVLFMLLRGVAGPVVVILTVIATFAAALGVCSIVFDSILSYPGVDPTVPLLSFVFLIALGVDYNVFLLGRVSQEIEVLGRRRGVNRALAVTGSVLTAAGLILAGTFTVLIILPLLPSKEIGLVVALGVLLDTLMVRTILVPALAIDMGPSFWWPRRTPVRAPG